MLLNKTKSIKIGEGRLLFIILSHYEKYQQCFIYEMLSSQKKKKNNKERKEPSNWICFSLMKKKEKTKIQLCPRDTRH